jgi:dihydrofolate reductase
VRGARQLTADLFVTLDGFAQGENAPAFFGCLGPDLQRWIDAEQTAPQVVVMGRVTYEAMASMAQPSDAMTRVAKAVVSRTLREPLAWENTRLLASDDALAALKDEPGDPLRVIGSLSLVRRLMGRRLVDRLRLMVFPQVLGASGREPVFAGGLPDIDLELLRTEVLDLRLVLLEDSPGTPREATAQTAQAGTGEA